ncbi:MAG: DUF86 domain-containing protein [Methanomassiliicoccaceae archaeon]|jgi:uncharacterized protein with HEPN domain|nr:DUF86 domain-containing protein [Methanomassiliicoccaceae archaeon]
MKDNAPILKKILKHCESIEDCITFFGRDEEIFLSNDIFQKSCAFDILQIGELIKSLPQEFRNEYGNIQWRGIAGVRDIIAHNYGSIRQGNLWIMITEEIPELRTECERILSKI